MSETPTTPPTPPTPPGNPSIPMQDLLAYRDGEPMDEGLRALIENDPHAQEKVARLGELKAQLNDLPPVVPEPALWANILQRVESSSEVDPLVPQAKEPQSLLQAQHAGIPNSQSKDSGLKDSRLKDSRLKDSWFNLATAAGVFGVALVGSLLWFQGSGVDPTAAQQVVLGQPMQQLDITRQDSGLDHLFDRSAQLEAALLPASGPQSTGDSSQRALLYRIADLDEELSSLQQEAMAPELKERLWRQRVELLETLTEIQRYQMLEENNAGAL